MNLRRIAASVAISLAVALAIGSALYSNPERAADARETIVLPPYDPARALLGRDEVIFTEDFENNAEGWQTSDLTIQEAAFHKSDFMADDHNNHWWGGDTITGYANPFYGYDNMWRQYLDTPVLDLSGASDQVSLTFRSRWLLEDPRRVPPPEGWDGWDGWMVLVSTDRGESFEVIRPESPAYTAEHISAAERFWMLEGDWPGWVFESKEGGRDAWDAANDTTPEPEWVNCTFSLGGHRSDGVVVRFMMVSDRTVSAVFSAEGQANRYLAESGILIDDVFIRDGDNVILSNNADDDPVPSELISRPGPGFGDTWALTREDVHTGTWAMWNDDDNFNVINTLDSPAFHVPPDGNTHLEFWVHCDLPDAVHEGSQALSDYYQIYVSNDDGGTWTYFTHDYNRVEAGGEGWVHYVPGVPFSGNLELSFSDTNYVDHDIRLRWLFATDADHREGNGAGLFIDDIQIINENQMNRDAGFENIYVGYPLRVNVRQTAFTADMINYGLRDLATIWSYWGYRNEDYGGESRVLPYPSIPTGDTTTIRLSDYVDRAVRGWTPVVPGLFAVYAKTAVGSQTPQDDSDDDEVPANDSTSVRNVMVWPTDIAELGYDNRTVHFMFEFQRGQGPAIRFSPGEAGVENYSVAFVRFLLNGGQQGDANLQLHFLRAGQDDSTPGQQIAAVDVVVPADSCLPNGMTVNLAANEALRDLNGDFWLWAELTQDGGRPQFVGDQLLRGIGRSFVITQGQAAVFNADLMIHAAVVPAGNRAANLAGVEEFFDFGEVPPEQSAAKNFTLYSTGITPVTIQSVSVNENSYEVMWPGETTLKAGESITFAIVFTPPDANVHAGDLIIESSDDSPPVITIAGSGAVSVTEELPVQPSVFGLSAPYPNPFNSISRFNFNLTNAGLATVTLHDLSGRTVAVVAAGVYTAGSHSATLRAIDLPTGLYLLKLQSNGSSSVQKVALIR